MNRLVIGSGACGFLRIYSLLKSCGLPVKYKGGKVKYQNSFETWNKELGLSWDVKESDGEKKVTHYLNELQGHIDINHYCLPYVPFLVKKDPNIKIICLKGRKEHSIKSLFTSWGYRNPLKTKRNEYRSRYVLEQFPDYSNDSLSFLDATTKYWDSYYELSEKYAKEYPDNFLIVDASLLMEPKLDNWESRKLVANLFDNQNIVNAKEYPVNYESNTISSTLHGGLGNNLFQMSEAIAFCDEFNLPKPKFGTWELQNGGNMFPEVYNADRLLGGHSGKHEDMINSFENLNWSSNLKPDYDVKFVINDMFSFSYVSHMRQAISERLMPSKEMVNYINEKYSNLYEKETVSLHFRFCDLGADDHVNGYIPFSFHENVLKSFPDDVNVLVFSDNNNRAREMINKLKETSNKQFHLIGENQFKSLFMMAKCNNHILHVSTLSFWGAYLETCWRKPEGRTVYHKEFNKCHTDKMISKELNWECIE